MFSDGGSYLPRLGIRAGGSNHKLGMSPNWESNLQPFRCGTMLQPTEPHQGIVNTNLLLSLIHNLSLCVFAIFFFPHYDISQSITNLPIPGKQVTSFPQGTSWGKDSYGLMKTDVHLASFAPTWGGNWREYRIYQEPNLYERKRNVWVDGARLGVRQEVMWPWLVRPPSSLGARSFLLP